MVAHIKLMADVAMTVALHVQVAVRGSRFHRGANMMKYSEQQ